MTRRFTLLSMPLLVVACGGPRSQPAPAPAPAPATEEPRRAGSAGEPLGRPAREIRLPPVERIPGSDSVAMEGLPPLIGPEVLPPADDDRAAARARRERPPVPVLPGAIIPRQRIIAFYGTPVSTRMGILGELPPDEMLARLDREVGAWRAADPATPARPALHVIAVMAAGDPGPDSLYRIRLPERHIERVMEWAARRDALVFLDIQTGLSDIRAELPRLGRWLIRPNVHLGLDPEWNMPGDARPGTRIGTMSADEVNHAIDYLADLVSEHGLPPKVLVVHRFTSSMLRNASDIRIDPRVQVVINMDGWGPPAQKIQAYRDIVAPEADQYTGFKLFYRNDLKGGSRLLTPAEILQLDPAPIYIQYQ